MKRATMLCAVAGAIWLAEADAYAQRAIFLVRHAEKLDDSRDPPLNEAGERRAARLATMLADAGVSAIYSTEFQRTLETAEPLAKALGLTISKVPRQTEEFIASVRSRHPDDVVLIVGHSNTVPDMLAWLGHRERVTIEDGEYSNLFVVTFGKNGGTNVVRLRF
jgi:broad specificity phosphatase PhoE